MMKVLLAIGFRPFYLLGSVFAVLALPPWLMSFSGKAALSPHDMPWHSHEMVFGFVPAILAGFLFTAVRNWTGRPTPKGPLLGVIVILWLAARFLLAVDNSIAAIMLDVLFLPVIAVAIAVPIYGSRNIRNYKVVTLVGILAALHILVHHPATVETVFSRQAMFAFVDVMAILFALIGGRIIPAFTRNAVAGSNPRYVPGVEFVAFGSLILVVALDLFGAYLPSPAWLPATLFVVAAASQLMRLALWQPQLTLGNPLLWMLPVAYSWLPLSLFLRVLATQGIVLPGTWLHAITIGAFSSLMMAMMMRSSLGHTGRPLAANRTDMAAFLLLQLAAIVRVLAGIVGDYRTAIILSGALWVAAFAVFLFRYLPVLARPRVDGKPG